MEPPLARCAVCGKPSNSFCYAIRCCTSCKLFYRRIRASLNLPTFCNFGGNCFDLLQCRFCRFQACVASGLDFAAHRDVMTQGFPSVMKQMDDHNMAREAAFLDIQIPENLLIDDYILSDSVSFVPKPQDFQPTWQAFTKANIYTSIDFVKRFGLVHLLSDKEKLAFVKQSHIQAALFYNAWWSFTNGKKVAEYPGGIDILPDDGNLNLEILDKIEFPIVGKLWELNMEYKEFLLLNGILVCDPRSLEFTEKGRFPIEEYQKLFTSELLRHCITIYKQDGPTRFMELLFILCLVQNVTDDYKHVLNVLDVLEMLNTEDVAAQQFENLALN